MTCSALLSVPPVDPALLFMLKSCLWMGASPRPQAADPGLHVWLLGWEMQGILALLQSLLETYLPAAGQIEIKWNKYVPKRPPLSGNLHIISFTTSKKYQRASHKVEHACLYLFYLSVSIWSGVHVHHCFPQWLTALNWIKMSLRSGGRILSLLIFGLKWRSFIFIPGLVVLTGT